MFSSLLCIPSLGRWTDGSFLIYNGWAASSPVGNENNYDCVKFTADGWKVEEGYCATSELQFVCRQNGQLSY